MKTVLIKCPNCGAPIERKTGKHFAKCEYCDAEICFDDIKEEAQVDVLKEKVIHFEKEHTDLADARKKISSWNKKRSLLFAGLGILNFLGFLLVGLSTDVDPGNSPLVGAGAICMLICWILFIVGSIFLSSSYPGDLFEKGKPATKFQIWLKMLLMTIGLLLLSAFAAFIVINIVENHA